MLKPLTKETFGPRLFALRRKAKLKQAELGAKIGVQGPTVSRWEDAHVLPSQDHIEALCKVFDVTEDYFTTEDGPWTAIRSVMPPGEVSSPDGLFGLFRSILSGLSSLDEHQLSIVLRTIDRLRSGGAEANDVENKIKGR